jgi:DNA-binding NtrC family response regulator
VVTILLPPLRHRREDIRPLTDRFIARAAADHGRSITGVEQAFYERLERYDWPGNVRQLRNVVESAVLLCPGSVLQAAALNIPDPGRAGLEGHAAVTFPEGMPLTEIERQVLEQTLARYQGNRTLTAEKLGLSRRTIQRKIKEHGLPF